MEDKKLRLDRDLRELNGVGTCVNLAVYEYERRGRHSAESIEMLKNALQKLILILEDNKHLYRY